MNDSVKTFLLWWATIIGIALLLRIIGKVEIDLMWLGISMIVDAVYIRIVLSKIQIPFINKLFPEPKFNWHGKIAAIVVTSMLIVIIVIFSEASVADLGLTLAQAEGSIQPALLATAFTLLFMMLVVRLVKRKPKADRETITYQATIPGIDEELYYRGLLLFTMSQALIGSESSPVAHPSAWSAILVTLLFGLVHSLMVNDGKIQFDLAALILVCILGSIFIWIRLTTGSILIPLIAHNLTNITSNTAPLLWSSQEIPVTE